MLSFSWRTGIAILWGSEKGYIHSNDSAAHGWSPMVSFCFIWRRFNDVCGVRWKPTQMPALHWARRLSMSASLWHDAQEVGIGN